MSEPTIAPQPAPRRCPTCSKTVAVEAEPSPFRPFCSRRCKLADLGRWLDEDFRISRPIGPDDQE